jgi:hypothetical protein
VAPIACNYRCQDYVTIDAGAGGTMEYCGNVVPPNPFIVGTGIYIPIKCIIILLSQIIQPLLANVGVFTLKFRSSFSDSYPGFQVFVTCLSSAGNCPVLALNIQILMCDVLCCVYIIESEQNAKRACNAEPDLEVS